MKVNVKTNYFFLALILVLSRNVQVCQAIDKSGVTPNTISLPTGPGSIEGLGESFQPTLNTGTAKYQVALTVPPGTAGHAPDLSLKYDSGGSNGPLGFGWTLGIPFIQRQADKGIPRYIDDDNGLDDDGDSFIDNPDEIDRFINEIKEELVPTANGFYFCENEGPFIRYRRVRDESHDHWEGTLPNGTLMEFGLTAGARITNAGTNHVFCWLLERQTDTNGNTIIYSYTSFPGTQNTNQCYLRKIEYGPGSPPWENKHFITFSYEDRDDWFEDCRSGFIVRTGKRLKEVIVGTQGPVLVGHAPGDFNCDGQNDYLNRKYLVSYKAHSHWSVLTSVTWVGADGFSTYPPLTLGYTISDPPDTVSASDGIIGSVNTPFQVMDNDLVDIVDLNGDGLPDILKTERYGGSHTAYLNKGEIDNNSSKVILWGDGTPVSTADGLAQNINLENGSNAIAHLADMDADGLADLVYKTAIGDVYFFPNDGKIGWGQRQRMNVNPSDSSPPSPFGTNDVKTADIDFDKHMDVIQSIIVGGGARYRIWFNLGNQCFSKSVTVSQNFGLMFSYPGVHIADFNGDRVPDILRVRPTGLQVTAGLGYGQFAPMVSVPLQDYTFNTQQVEKARLQDINGDGLVDLVVERAAPGQLWYWINLGNYTLTHRKIIIQMPTAIGTNPEIRWADLNGNGTTDIVYADRYASPTIQTIDIGRLIGCVPSPNMLVSIDNGIGRKTTIEYSTSTQFLLEDHAKDHIWPNPLPFPVNVVSKVTVDDSMGNLYITEYSYHDGYYDGEEKEFRGFAKVEKKEIGDSTIPDLIMVHKFDTGAENEALKGKIREIQARNTEGEIFWSEDNTWVTRELCDSAIGDGRKVAIPLQEAKIRDVIEKGNGPPVQLKWEYEYDNYGNITRQIEHGRVDPGWNDERITETSYTAAYQEGRAVWILQGTVEVKTTDEDGVLAAHSRNYYDGSMTLGSVSKGNLTLVETWVENDEWIDSLGNKYNSYGNIIAIYDPLYNKKPGHYRELLYDNDFHAFPEEEIIYTGNEVCPTLTLKATYNKGHGVVTSSTELNGHTTTYGYDNFGRLISITKPPYTDHTVEYDYVLAHDLGDGRIISWVETRQRDGSFGDGFMHMRNFYDGLGRKIMTRSEGEVPEQVVVTDAFQFNARKTLWKSYLPYFDYGTLEYTEPSYDIGYTESFYDAIGREVKVNQPEEEGKTVFATIQYSPLVRTELDEEQTNPESSHYGSANSYTYDGLERLIEVLEKNQGETYFTRYEYDILDNLTRITDTQNNIKTIEYDGLKRRIALNDPDCGYIEYTYDDAGNVVQTVDNKRQKIVYTYDGANRPLTEDYQDTAQITPDIKYHYDEPSTDYPHAKNIMGRLSWLEDLTGALFLAYDPRGNIEWSVKRIEDGGFSSDYMFLGEFDAMDRVASQTFPDGDQITYDYNSRSLLDSIHGFVESIDYCPSGQVEKYIYTNGLATIYTYDSRNRLVRLTTDATIPTGNPIQDLVYTFDGISNVSSIDDQRILPSNLPKIATQAFQYDDLYRLTKAKGSGFGTINYQYDKIGNMIFKNSPPVPNPDHVDDPRINLGKMTSGGSDGTSNRGIKLPGDSPGPHAVTGTDSGLVFDYDDNGNMINHNGDIYEWDFKNRLVKTTTESTVAEYVYNYSGQRTIKKSQSNGEQKIVYYVRKDYEIRNEKLVKYVFDGSRRVACIDNEIMESSEQKSIYFYLPDQIGSSNIVTDAQGNVVESIVFYPFGFPRYEERSNFNSAYKYANKELDMETNLMYYGARYYDAVVGRFVSLDPIVTDFTELDDNKSFISLNPQGANGYVYSGNNPTSRLDPDGKEDIQFHLKESNEWIGKENLLDELGLVGQVAEILSVLPYQRPGKVSEEGKFINRATQCTSFGRMLLSIFVENRLNPRRTYGETPGAVFGVNRVPTPQGLLAIPDLEKVKKRELKSLNKDKLYALQSFSTGGAPKHVSLLVYSDWLGDWITIESTTRTKGRILSESTGANIYRLSDVKGKNRVFNAYEIGSKYKPRDPSLENWDFIPDEEE